MELDHGIASFVMQERPLARKKLCSHVRNRQRIKCVREGIDYDKAKDRRLYVKVPRQW